MKEPPDKKVKDAASSLSKKLGGGFYGYHVAPAWGQVPDSKLPGWVLYIFTTNQVLPNLPTQWEGFHVYCRNVYRAGRYSTPNSA